MQNILNSLFI